MRPRKPNKPEFVRQRVLFIAPQVLVKLFVQGEELSVRVLEGCPPDTKICGAYYDCATDLISIILEHPDFEPVLRRTVLPKQEVILQRIEVRNVSQNSVQ